MAEVGIVLLGDNSLAGSLIYSVPLKTAGQILHRGRSWLYEALGAGLLDAVKNVVNTEITVESIRRYQANMPRVTIKPAKPHALESLHKLHEKPREERAKRRTARRRAVTGGARRLAVTDVTESHVRDLVKAKARDYETMARNLLALIRRIFNWAIDQRAYGLEHSPCARLKPNKLVGEQTERTRVLCNLEMRALWRAAEAMGGAYGKFYQMLLLTGNAAPMPARCRSFN